MSKLYKIIIPTLATILIAQPTAIFSSTYTLGVSAYVSHTSANTNNQVNVNIEYDGNKTKNMSDKANLIKKQLVLFPLEIRKQIKKIIISSRNLPRRGYAGSDTIVLDSNLSDDEFLRVFIHELGHIEDLGVLSGTNTSPKSGYIDGVRQIYTDDISLDFYQICWRASGQSMCSEQDFVSGYASTDMFEDFAESFIFYVRFGEDFRILSSSNPIISTKYNFFKNKVFAGREFATGQNITTQARAWDITKIK